MTPESWIALLAVALTFATSLIVVSYKLGGLSQRVDGLDEWRKDVSTDVKAMRNMLENISGAISARKIT